MFKKKYFDKKKKYFHGIMFHNFHDHKKHKIGQGSISKEQFLKIINFIGKKNILSADEFINKYNNKTLKKNHVCLTFDDGSLSQFDVALPVLKKLKIKAFFFLYSSMFTNKPDLLEIYRYFRLNFYKNVDHFYHEFFQYLDPKYINFLKKKKEIIKKKKITYGHYSINDIKFRLIRNDFITQDEYKNIMVKLFKKKNFVAKNYYNRLFLQKKHLIKINKLGHIIGLHSHTHPTMFKKLTYLKQLKEYKKNIEIFSKILKCPKEKFKSMSHPCGSFNANTLKILKKLNIEIGFREKMLSKNQTLISKYKIPRQDHTDIINEMKN